MTAKNTKPKINELDYNNKDKIYVNNKGYKFKIIDRKSECSIAKSGNKKWTTKYLVKFDSGFEIWSAKKEICNGSVKDWLSPYVCGVGIVGIEIDHPQSHYLYDRWRDMLRRCYDKDCKLYHVYGGSGVTVCDEWKYFPNFVRDIENKENCEKLKETHSNPKDRYELDKDLIKKGNKIYCNEYTCIVPHDINMKERNERRSYNKEVNQKGVWRISKDFKEVKLYNCISDAGRDLTGNTANSINACCSGDIISCYGYYWRKVEDFNTIEDAIEDVKIRISLSDDLKFSKLENNKRDFVLVNAETGVIEKEFLHLLNKELADILNVNTDAISRYLYHGVKYRNKYYIRLK